jgi:hypothetical protein
LSRRTTNLSANQCSFPLLLMALECICSVLVETPRTLEADGDVDTSKNRTTANGVSICFVQPDCSAMQINIGIRLNAHCNFYLYTLKWSLQDCSWNFWNHPPDCTPWESDLLSKSTLSVTHALYDITHTPRLTHTHTHRPVYTERVSFTHRHTHKPSTHITSTHTSYYTCYNYYMP